MNVKKIPPENHWNSIGKVSQSAALLDRVSKREICVSSNTNQNVIHVSKFGKIWEFHDWMSTILVTQPRISSSRSNGKLRVYDMSWLMSMALASRRYGVLLYRKFFRNGVVCCLLLHFLILLCCTCFSVDWMRQSCFCCCVLSQWLVPSCGNWNGFCHKTFEFLLIISFEKSLFSRKA